MPLPPKTCPCPHAAPGSTCTDRFCVHACSYRPDIHEWLYYYTQLGVSRFHMYWPTLHSHEHKADDAPLELWEDGATFQARSFGNFLALVMQHGTCQGHPPMCRVQHHSLDLQPR